MVSAQLRVMACRGGSGGGGVVVVVLELKRLKCNLYCVCGSGWLLGRTTVGCGLFVRQSAQSGSSLEVESASN